MCLTVEAKIVTVSDIVLQVCRKIFKTIISQKEDKGRHTGR